ncbi:aminotransferase class IV [Arcticibacter sp. MXS-1]|uniref:aminotransferase class IV n=1 Tax=Arcticibacter sp. MXS-1 TaxID=3341726 RepID=UPI0035A980F6
MNFINFNGDIFPATQPVLQISNRSFRYGDGLFESMRMIRGELKFAEFHAERLRNGMQALGLEGVSAITADFLKQKVVELAIRNEEGENARVRLTVFRDSDGLYSPSGNGFGYSVEMSPTTEAQYVSNTKGLIVDVYEELTKPANFLSNYKTCNSLIYVMAGIYRKKRSLDEVFILNNNGFLCETMSSNVFVLFNKTLYTPSLGEGCIAGVMRRVIMEIAGDNDVPVVEAQINPNILNEAEEVFLTNTSRGIQWVMGFNSKRYFNKLSKMLLDKLNESL